MLTAAVFVASFSSYGASWKAAFIDYFLCILITLCITDCRERLIPHALTYPSIIVGILYSIFVRHDLIGALAAIGISYFLFDFIAFYGQSMYLKLISNSHTDHSGSLSQHSDALSAHPLIEDFPKADELNLPKSSEQAVVLGGGDAVLAALIGSFLGWERLLDALFFSMILGGIMAASYRIFELHKLQLIGQIVKPAIIGFFIGFTLIAICFAGFAIIFSPEKMAPVIAGWMALALTVGIGGSLSGTVLATFKKAKYRTFPLAPALALGGAIALFCDPVGAIVRGGS
jgi:prepilin signal peptidase PulO-like enzyme (type II secretory pathway)